MAELKKQIYMKLQILRLQILTCFIFLFLNSKKSDGFTEEGNPPSEKAVAAWGNLDGIYIDDIGNFVDSPKLVFIDEECGNLLRVNQSEELAFYKTL